MTTDSQYEAAIAAVEASEPVVFSNDPKADYVKSCCDLIQGKREGVMFVYRITYTNFRRRRTVNSYLHYETANRAEESIRRDTRNKNVSREIDIVYCY